VVLFLPCVLLVACAEGVVDTPDDTQGPPPAGPPAADAGSGGTSYDAGGGGSDSATAGEDAGHDSGHIQPDAAPTACQASLASAKFDFESGAQGWTHAVMDDAQAEAPSWPFDAWGQGAAGNTLGCHNGACFATSPVENYVQCGRAELRSPAIDLSKCASASSVTITFQHAWHFWTGSYGGTTWFDGGIIEISGDGGQTWQAASGAATNGTIKINPSRGAFDEYACVLPDAFHVDGKTGFTGASSGWQAGSVDVPAALRTSHFMIRFAYGAGVSSATSDSDASKAHTGPGWHVDDVAASAQ
jgi:hypothetical protein